MDRDADGPGLVGNGAGNGLADPPCRIGTEFIAFAVVEFVDGFQQAQVPFLDEVQEQHAPADIAFGNADDEAQVGIGQFLLGNRAGFDVFFCRIGSIALFNGLGQGNFFCRRQQGDAADFFQVHADRVIDIDAFRYAEVDIVQIRHFFCIFIIYIIVFIHGIIFADDVDALVGKDFVHLIDLVRRQFVFFHEVHDFCIGQAAFLLPHLQELLDVLQGQGLAFFFTQRFLYGCILFLGRLTARRFLRRFFRYFRIICRFIHHGVQSPFCSSRPLFHFIVNFFTGCKLFSQPCIAIPAISGSQAAVRQVLLL